MGWAAGLLAAGCGSSLTDTSGTGGSASAGLDPAALSTRLEADVAAIQVAGRIPGVAVGIWTPTSSWVRSFGRATVNPDRALDLTDIFSWRSVTKSFVVTLILQLVQNKLLGLDDPISKFVDGVPQGDSISLRHLSGMTSGLFDYVRTQAVGQAIQADPLRHFSVEELLLPALAEGIHFAPGSQYEYCNTNTLLLGLVVEKATGQPLEVVLRSRILDPLGLNHCAFLDGPNLPEPATKGYVFEAGVFEEVSISHSALWAAGAMAGRLDDARSWALALSSGSLLSPQLQAERVQGRRAVNGPIYDNYGLGIGEVQGWLGHTGEGVGYALGFFGEPLSGSLIAIEMNASNSDSHDMPVRLLRRFLATLGWPIAPPAEARL